MMMNSKKLVVIVGPTASGKTDVSIQLAKHLGAEIVSSDSRQIYRGMDIGTATPDADQLRAVPHHLISAREITEAYTSGMYEHQALEIIGQLHTQDNYVILVGGSGLYIDAVCRGMDAIPDSDPKLRSELNAQLESEGIEPLLTRLKELDPEHYESMDRSNPNRVIRALEVCLTTGGRYSDLRTGAIKERDFELIKIGVTLPREELYARINLRVDIMVEQGLVEEARRLYPLRSENALNTVGYKELFQYFDGLCTLDEAIRMIKQNSRRYAKRQMTWFRRDEQIRWFDPKEIKNMEIFIENFGK